MALAHLLLVRLSGDLCTKARPTRLRFTRRLARNLTDALRASGRAFRVERQWSRILIETEDPAAMARVARVFGVQSVSPVERRPWSSLEDLVEQGDALFREVVRDRRFAVRARRNTAQGPVPFRSGEVERELGRRLDEVAARVDLGDPEVVVSVEVHPREAYFFLDKTPGPGGLPIHVEGKALALVSGGFDSGVAAWLMLRRGVGLDYVFFNLGGAAHRQGVLRSAKVLSDDWSYGYQPLLHEIDFQGVVEALRGATRSRFWQVLIKRLMLRAGELLARELGRPALVTGEAVGQVSSQTLQNLAVLSAATRLTLLRPLLGFNKDEIIERSRRIGTYDLAAAMVEYCAILPRQPATHASFEAVAGEEAKLDLSLLERVVAERTVWDLRRLDLEQVPDDLAIASPDALQGDVTLLDLRSRQAYAAGHLAGALHLDFERALAGYPSFDRDPTYVVYCELGLKSAHLAEQMRRHGLRAFHLRRGARQLLRRAGPEDPVLDAVLAPAHRGD